MLEPVSIAKPGIGRQVLDEAPARLLKITAAIADAVTDDEVFEALVDRVADAVEASSAGLWIVEEGGRGACLARARGYAPAALERMKVIPLDQSPAMPVLDSIREGEPVWISSQASLLERYPNLATMVSPARSYRVSCLPLTAQGRVLGGLALTIEAEQDATEEERHFLLLVARYASQALERLRLFDAERRNKAVADAAAARLEVLNRASRAFDAELDLEARLRTVAAELSGALDSSINLALIEGDGLLHLTEVHHPIPGAHARLREIARGAPLQVGEGVTGTIAATGRSVILPRLSSGEVAARAPEAYREFLERYPVYAMMGAALRVHGRTIGTVTAARCREGQTFVADDLKLLEELGERAAVAIENSRLHRETVQGRARAEQLYRFAQAVVAADKVEVVFDAALDALETALGATRAAILTADAAGVMRFRAWRNLSPAYRAAVEGHSPWPRDATAPQPITVGDVSADSALAPFATVLREEGIKALAFIPLATRGRLIGKFMVYRDRPCSFPPHELETARAIGNHLASVITRFEVVAKLEDTVRHSELFAAILAHDLRNPLGAILTSAQLELRRREGEPRASARDGRPLGRIITSGERMLGMIEQLLDLTRARVGGGIRVQPRPVSLRELCAQVVSELELTRPECKVHCEALGDLEGAWDPDRLLQALSNLLANAGEHGDAATGVHVRLDGSSTNEVVIAIHNMGAIPDALLPHIFDPFRSTRHPRVQSRGLGLGLFIVKEIVGAHGGVVEVSSSIATGTTFTVRLPRRAPRAAE